MKFNHIIHKISRNDNTSFDIGEFKFLRESCTVRKFISDQSRNKSQNILLGKRCLNHREYIIHNLKDRRKSGYLRLVKKHSKHSSLTFCTSHIKTCRVTDTAVRCNLYTIKMISSYDCLLIFRFWFWFLDGCIIFTCQFRSFHTIVIHMFNFSI